MGSRRLVLAHPHPVAWIWLPFAHICAWPTLASACGTLQPRFLQETLLSLRFPLISPAQRQASPSRPLHPVSLVSCPPPTLPPSAYTWASPPCPSSSQCCLSGSRRHSSLGIPSSLQEMALGCPTWASFVRLPKAPLAFQRGF